MQISPKLPVAYSESIERLIIETARLSNRDRSEIRPFVCSGAPRECDVFIVGTNPASTVSWSEFWDPTNEQFDKDNWTRVYQHERAQKKRNAGKLRAHAVSPTRRRIELFVDAVGRARRVLETNVFSVSTPSEKDLKPADLVPLIFDFLLETIQPKALFVHGNIAARYLRDRFNVIPEGSTFLLSLPYGNCPVIFAPHLASRTEGVTNARVTGWGQSVRDSLCR